LKSSFISGGKIEYPETFSNLELNRRNDLLFLLMMSY